MFRDNSQAKPKAPACAACGSPGLNGFWGRWLCDGCHGVWHAEAIPLGPLELAHADAHPADVDSRGEYQFRDQTRTGHQWVLLKPGVVERIAERWALAWLGRRQATMRGAA